MRSPVHRSSLIVHRSAFPLSGVDIGPQERAAVLRVLGSGRLALGPAAAEFEEELAGYAGVKYGVAVSSGTAGLHLVVRALGIGPGDEVITTPFSFVASANCLVYEGARPVFADIDAESLNIAPAKIEACITRRTRAILAVDVFGHPADWPGLRAVARRHKLALIEDACEALGAGIGPISHIGPIRRCGSFGDAAVFAFYPNKQITTGEGGMVVTNNARVAELCRSMANQGRRMCGNSWLEHVRLGYNYRMSEINAALGLAQLRRLRSILGRRRRVAACYAKMLTDTPGVHVPHVTAGAVVSWFVYVVRLAERYTKRDRDRMLVRLRQKGVECSDYFRPIHLQPFYRRAFGYRQGDFPIAEFASGRTIALPFHARMGGQDVRTVVRIFRQVL